MTQVLSHGSMRLGFMLVLMLGLDLCSRSWASEPRMTSELIFPLNDQHNHAPGIVQFDNGDLLVSWYRGSGERTADDVRIYGARLSQGSRQWSQPFLMADRPGFPDCNTCMFLDHHKRLWLFWPTVIANTWESCLTNAAVSSQPQTTGAPQWDRQTVILLKPDDFAAEAEQRLDRYLAELDQPLSERQRAEIEAARRRLHDKLYQRLGWQPRCKPTVLPSGRILLPLYSDTFSISIMAISDDEGATWYASRPLLGFGNIQPSVLRRDDGTLVAYMRENGTSGRVRVCQSTDDGVNWGEVVSSELPNPGSGLDGVRLTNGHWVLVYNDLASGRRSLAISLSTDEGRTWKKTRHLEHEPAGSYHYPAVIEGHEGMLHIVYSYFVAGGKSMKHVAANEAWILAGESTGAAP